MIINKEALSISEISDYVSKENEDVLKFVKEFAKLKPDKAKELRKKIEEIGLIQLNGSHISKLIDFMPEDIEDLNKIFADLSFDESEAQKILEVIKEFK
jgi:DNA-directed RNA polymerase subunit F